ncbi:MAG: hypothetical protein AUJ72_04990 [Candidatus Omnitrophica bacterium CG1_02_46_14]|nr:MAG: hypothetical protein AUJ72_04990 [Candidatus Omnitrophica bacterium CG1_02_46_14]
MLNKFKNHFVTGLVMLSPFFLTLFFFEYLIRLADHFVVNPLFKIFPFNFDASFKIFLTKFVILTVVIICVALIGWTAEKFVFKRLFSTWEGFLDAIPFVNKIYGSIKEVAQAFFGDKAGLFKRVVYVEYPRKGLYALGFVMQEKPWEIHEITGKEMVNVFLPHPPNPATGYFIFVPKEEAIESKMSVEEGIRMVISAGAAVPLLRKK